MAGMIESGSLDKITGGFIGMGMFICYGIGQLVCGYLGDKVKPQVLIGSGLGVTALCNLTMPLLPNAVLMIPVWALNGFAQAMLWPPIVRILSVNLDRERFVRANLLVTSAAHVATILLYLYVPVCLRFFAWETVFFTATVLALLSIVLFFIGLMLVIPKNAGKASQGGEDTHAVIETIPLGRYLRMAIGAGIIPVFLSIIMMGIMRDGIESWLPTLYSEAFNQDAQKSILLSVLLPVFSIVSIVVITALHKTKLFQNETRGSAILFALSFLMCIPVCLLIDTEITALRIVCLVLAVIVCGCMHGCNFLYISCLPGRFAKYGRTATTSGISNAFTYVGAALSTYGFALLAELFSWRATVISWIAVCAIGAVLSLVASIYYTKFINAESWE
jgi:OPA family glycerol-3-phosphate transporter-like MFS transporter